MGDISLGLRLIGREAEQPSFRFRCSWWLYRSQSRKSRLYCASPLW